MVLDNPSTLFRSGKEYESDSWLPTQNWLLGLRSLNKSVLLIHYAGKGGQQKRTSRREDFLDTVITMKKPKAYKEQDGVSLEFYFEKIEPHMVIKLKHLEHTRIQ